MKALSAAVVLAIGLYTAIAGLYMSNGGEAVSSVGAVVAVCGCAAWVREILRKD